ncbi:MAG: acetyl-CoA carboxylase carboxyltransferase subunit beta [Acholeplasmataceae bacterium]|nr:acetyl-CoA carboxylase carboxyltransferase subunit beta [Acholeplasmataceae bacterium]
MDNFLDKHRSRVVYFQEKYRKRGKNNHKAEIPDQLFSKCPFCQELIYTKTLIEQAFVCPECGKYYPMSARDRIDQLTDSDSFEEIDRTLTSVNPLDFPGYNEKLVQAQEETGEREAFIGGWAKIDNIPLCVGVMDSHFLMGSMGSAIGEKIARLMELSIKRKSPLLIVSSSGGARMQEGILSLMQMAKTVALLTKHNESGLLFISLLTHPTTGGVSASFAMLGDIILAEKGALIGFAGKRVIQQTIKEDLPDGFQTAEFLMDHGMIDMVIDRKNASAVISQLLKFHEQRKNHVSN